MSAVSRRVGTAVAGAAIGALVLAAAPASAHVSVDGEVAPGGSGSFTFTVPNERGDASTTKLEVAVPEDSPLGSLRVQPKPGWRVTITTRTLDEPVEVFGSPVTEVVDTVAWTADGPGIGVDEFDTFTLRGGPFPDGVDLVAFPAIQTYDTGEEVAWIERTVDGQPEPEPEHPAPVLALSAPDTEDEGGDNGLAVAGLVAGLAGLAAGGVAIALARRR